MAFTTQSMSGCGAVVRAGSALASAILPVFSSTVKTTVTFPAAVGVAFRTVS